MTVFERAHLFIGGEWRRPWTADRFEVVSPSTEEVVGRVPAGGPEDIDRAVAAARIAFDEGPWPRMALADRLEILERFADALEARSEELIRLCISQTGLAYSGKAGAMLIPGGLRHLRNYIKSARDFPFRRLLDTDAGPTVVSREPVGVVAGIPPWNGPFSHNLAKLMPGLTVGCTVVLKPPPETPLDSFVIAECLSEAGVPAGVVSVVPGGRETGRHLVNHPGIDKVSFTGSTAAGREIAATCGEQLKRCTLELGGKSAAIILADADVVAALPALLDGSVSLAGQQCYALSRVLVPYTRMSEVVDVLTAAFRALRVGDPFDPATDVGPLISARQRERVEGYIAIGRDEGADVIVGGSRPAHLSRGWYVEPTIFAGADNSMRIAREEIFGPVMTVIGYTDENEAVAIANDSAYGLSGAVFTSDVDLGIDIASRVRTGTYTVNGFRFNPLAPFGGFKASGIGREWGEYGLASHTEFRAVSLPRT